MNFVRWPQLNHIDDALQTKFTSAPKPWTGLTRRHPDLISMGDKQRLEYRDFCDRLYDPCNRLAGVIRNHPYQKDRVDFWQPDPSGDCEDKCLAAMMILNQSYQLPLECMALAIIRTLYSLQHHAVLLIYTTRGTFVLDPQIPMILPWEKIQAHSWLMRHCKNQLWEYFTTQKPTEEK